MGSSYLLPAFLSFLIGSEIAAGQVSIDTVRYGTDEPEWAVPLPPGTTSFTVDPSVCVDTFAPSTTSSPTWGLEGDVFFAWQPTRTGEVTVFQGGVLWTAWRAEGPAAPGVDAGSLGSRRGGIDDLDEFDSFEVDVGDTIVFQIGHFHGGWQPAWIRIWEDGREVPIGQCLANGSTGPIGSNGLPSGQYAFVDVVADGPVILSGVWFEDLLDNYGIPFFGPSPGYFEVHVCPGGAAGHETDASRWTLASIGYLNGRNGRLVDPILLPEGRTGLAIVAVAQFSFVIYSHGGPESHVLGRREIVLFPGSVSSAYFDDPVLVPATFAGALCFEETDWVERSYCGPAQSNSTGQRASLHARGSDVAADRDLELVAAGLPAGSPGYVLVSQTAAYVPMAGGSEGTLCVGVPLGRYAGTVLVADDQGLARMDIDPAAIPQPGGTVGAIAGETWRFQHWYRDVSTLLTTTSNHTDGIEVAFR
ncbi:MAG: hypothetical protein AAGA20_03545 [Planctomycetota bacterium]